MSRNKFKRNVDYVTKQELTKTVGEIPKAKIATLTDVDIVSNQPTDGDVLIYDEALGKWIPNAPQSSPLPYKSYVALLTQSSTNAPSATVIYNDLGTVTWTRDQAGVYTGTTSGLLTSSKTALFLTPINVTQNSLYRNDTNTVQLKTTNGTVLGDGQLNSTTIEIRVYN